MCFRICTLTFVVCGVVDERWILQAANATNKLIKVQEKLLQKKGSSMTVSVHVLCPCVGPEHDPVHPGPGPADPEGPAVRGEDGGPAAGS